MPFGAQAGAGKESIMKIIEQLLTGEIDITEFVNTLKVNPDLKETIKHLIPREAITDHNHVLWQTISY